jgi:hypothetical protein
MHALPSLTVLPAPPGEPLCRAGGHTCATCCHGPGLDRPLLVRRLRRQTRLFARCVGAAPTRGRLLRFEMAARGAAGLAWAVLLLVPTVGRLLRPWLARRTVCAFLGFEDVGERRVGCLLHPARWQGREMRGAAFGLWRGFGCGPADFLCLAGWRFARAPLPARRRFLRASAGLDWFAFGRAALGFRARS